jgi:DNA-binding PadR family transcriptional regulator
MPIFGYGDMRLYLLKLLSGSPRYGYELIRLLEEQFLGGYVPSAGAIYPRLSSLEEEGLITHEIQDGRKVYRLTEKGQLELEKRHREIDDLEARVTEWAGGLAESVVEGVRPLIEKLNMRIEDLDDPEAIRDLIGRHPGRDRHVRVIRDEARARARVARDEARDSRRGRRPVRRDEWEGPGRNPGLRGDLRAFVDEVSAAVSEFPPDKATRREVQRILFDTRQQIADLLEERAPAPTAEAASSPEESAETVEVEVEIDEGRE